jgi:phospholipid/cholesterol/gamma-HCH transport system substrate-binding protein
MQNQGRHATGVGIFTAIVIATVVGVVLFLRGTLNTDKQINVIFDDAYGLQRGESVQMAGVRVGQVDAIDLREDSKAIVRLGIRREREIPEGSFFRIKSGILGNSRTVAIEPKQGNRPLSDGATVNGDSSAPIDEALAETQNLVKAGQDLVASVQKLTDDPEIQEGLKENLRNTVAITENLKKTTQNLPRLERRVEDLIGDFKRTTQGVERITRGVELLAQDARFIAGDARKVTRNLDGTVTDGRKQLVTLLESATEATDSVAILVNSLNQTLTSDSLKTGVDKILVNGDTASKNFVVATEKLNTIAEKFDRMAANFEKLSGDEELTKDIRTTVTNLKETSESVRNLAERVEAVRLPWEKAKPKTESLQSVPTSEKSTPEPFSNTSLIEPGLVFDATYDTTLERLRTDVGYTLRSGQHNFYRLGLADVTESNRLNLQVGWANRTPMTFSYRYGIFAGKLGLGVDMRPGPVDFRLDFYDPNRFTMDARAKVYLNRSSAITAGVSGIGKENRATVGVQFLR